MEQTEYILRKKLAKVEKQLMKYRGCSPLTHGWQTMRYAKADRNWDYYAQEKWRLLRQLDDLTENKQQ